jgi:hypothetical protein
MPKRSMVPQEYFDPSLWRNFTKEEIQNYLESLNPKSKLPRKKGGVLVLRNLASPLDIYTYLQARFGRPNGIQTLLKRDDSDNIFHWDYYLMAGNSHLFFIGATQEVHVWTQDNLSDEDWLRLIENLKKDYQRVGSEKKKVLARLEKWSIFPNHFLSLANRCATSYEKLRKAVEIIPTLKSPSFVLEDKNRQNAAKKEARLYSDIMVASTELSVLTPVMFEAFIGLIVAVFIKPAVKKNKRVYESFVRGPLDVKLFDMHTRCKGFEKEIDQENPFMKKYWSVVNRRNDTIHGNVDPIRDAIDTVYFDGKVPLFRSGGDRIKSHWESIERQYKPNTILDDYITTHEFIYEIINHMRPAYRETMYVLMEEAQPGYDQKREIFGKLFPDFVAAFLMPGLKYDNELVRPSK